MGLCVMCGKKLRDDQKKYCSRVCFRLGKIKQKRVKFKTCQFCGKELNHIVERINNGHKGVYVNPNKKYCDKGCEAKHRKEWMKGKKTNFAVGLERKALNPVKEKVFANLANFSANPFEVIMD